jgi:hypothetical protein
VGVPESLAPQPHNVFGHLALPRSVVPLGAEPVDKWVRIYRAISGSKYAGAFSPVFALVFRIALGADCDSQVSGRIRLRRIKLGRFRVSRGMKLALGVSELTEQHGFWDKVKDGRGCAMHRYRIASDWATWMVDQGSAKWASQGRRTADRSPSPSLRALALNI